MQKVRVRGISVMHMTFLGCLIVALFVFVTYLVVFSVDYFRYVSSIQDAGEIEIGDSIEEVLQKMGEPLRQWPKGTKLWGEYEFETWVYGRRFSLEGSFDSEPPYFYPVFLWPVRWRGIGYARDDVVLEFDSAGKVVSIQIPQ